MSDKSNNSDLKPYQEHEKFLKKQKSTLRKAVTRGLFFLVLLVVVTYFGKLRPAGKKTISEHGLVGWVFYQHEKLSVLIVLPNDGNYSNHRENGARLLLHPPTDPMALESNYIHYNKKDLYLLGDVFPHHVKNYCSEVDSASRLVFVGDSTWNTLCPHSVVLEKGASPLVPDWGIQTNLQMDKELGFLDLTLNHSGQILRFSSFASEEAVPGSLFWIETKELMERSPNVQLYINPKTVFRKKTQDSTLILTEEGQALGFTMEEDGRLMIKKMWLRESIL